MGTQLTWGCPHFAGLSRCCVWLSDMSEDIKKRNTDHDDDDGDDDDDDDDHDDDDDPLETKVVFFSYETLPKENQEKEG